jgi:hypothetical protein
MAQGEGGAKTGREADHVGKEEQRDKQEESNGNSLRMQLQLASTDSGLRQQLTGRGQTPHLIMPKLFGELRERYADRPGGYTRVLRAEPKDTYSQAPSAVLELVDGPKDMRFAMTAAAVARDRKEGNEHTELTMRNMAKVTRFRKDGNIAFEKLVGRLGNMKVTV